MREYVQIIIQQEEQTLKTSSTLFCMYMMQRLLMTVLEFKYQKWFVVLIKSYGTSLSTVIFLCSPTSKKQVTESYIGGKEASAWYVAIHRLFVPCDAYMIVLFK